MYGQQRISLAASTMEAPRSFLSWRQEIILRAAAQADYVPFRYRFPEQPGEMSHGVFRSLVMRGFLRQHPHGYQITELGLAKAERMR